MRGKDDRVIRIGVVTIPRLELLPAQLEVEIQHSFRLRNVEVLCGGAAR